MTTLGEPESTLIVSAVLAIEAFVLALQGHVTDLVPERQVGLSYVSQAASRRAVLRPNRDDPEGLGIRAVRVGDDLESDVGEAADAAGRDRYLRRPDVVGANLLEMVRVLLEPRDWPG